MQSFRTTWDADFLMHDALRVKRQAIIRRMLKPYILVMQVSIKTACRHFDRILLSVMVTLTSTFGRCVSITKFHLIRFQSCTSSLRERTYQFDIVSR